MNRLGGEKQLPPVLAARWAVVAENVLRTAILVEYIGARRTYRLIPPRPDQDVGLAARLWKATQFLCHRLPNRAVAEGGAYDSMSDLVQKCIDDIRFGVLIGVESSQGDQPPSRAAEAEHLTEGAKLQPPTSYIQAVPHKQLSGHRDQLCPVHDTPLFVR
jgi:hypothetical protein